jgi:beta-glucosidase
MGWTIRPEGLHRVITQAHERYKLDAVYITENGAAFEDAREGNAVHDDYRKSYLQSHTAAPLRAKAEGIPVKGFFARSLMDNFERALRYSKRSGIIYVDYSTQERIVKDSGRSYGELARSGAPER